MYQKKDGLVKVMSIQWLSRHWEDMKDERPSLIVIDEASCIGRNLQGTVAALSGSEEIRHDRHALPVEPERVYGLV